MKIFSFDAETNGLWGQPFALGAVVYEDGVELDRFIARCPIRGEVNPWVEENVLPQMKDIPVTYHSYDTLLEDFAAFWLSHKDAACLVHMGHIVEADIFRTLQAGKFIGDWDAPYKWFDVCILPGVGDNVDGYAKAHNLPLPDLLGGTHNPLHDCMVTATVYFDYFNKEEEV